MSGGCERKRGGKIIYIGVYLPSYMEDSHAMSIFILTFEIHVRPSLQMLAWRNYNIVVNPSHLSHTPNLNVQQWELEPL